MSLFTELSRRNVWRAAAAYIVAAWIVIQVTETILPLFGFGDLVIRTVVIVLGIGFIPAMVLAWIFEWTPEGLRRESEVDDDAPSSLAMSRRTDRLIMIFLAFGMAYFAVDKFVLDPVRDESLARDAAQEARSEAMVESYGNRSIAVLPFVNMSADPENEYFSDGMSEELLNLLSQVPDLRVISRSSSFAFKGKEISIPEVSKQLNSAFILEGSVRKAGNLVRITAQLVDGRTDTHVWSATYDRTLDDVFAIQDEISAAIVEALRPRMNLVAGDAPSAVKTQNIQAHEAYLRGQYLFRQRSIEGAVEALEDAVLLDPDYAPAQAALALAYRFVPIYLGKPKDEWVEKARPHAQRALELAPNLAEAHAAMGYVLVYHETMDQAIAEFRKAVQLNPNYADARGWLAGFLEMKGNLTEAYEQRIKALHLDPLSTVIRRNVIVEQLRRNHLEEADRELEKLRGLDTGAYRHLMIMRKSLGGKWADAALAALQAWSLDAGADGAYELTTFLAVLNFPEDAWPQLDEPNVWALRAAGEPSRIVALMQNPQGIFQKQEFAQALAGAGEFDRAAPLLEEIWTFIEQGNYTGLFSEYQVMALRASRLSTGTTTANGGLLAYMRRSVEVSTEGGVISDGIFWDADFQAGIADWLAEQRESALGLIRKAVERGFFVFPNEAYLQDLYHHPGFAPIMEIQREHRTQERTKFLSVVCHDNPDPGLWSPPIDACQSLNE